MFGIRIAELRKEQGLTQYELAEKIGIKRSALSLYETEKREPNVETFIKLAAWFGTSVDYLMGETSERCETKAAILQKALEEILEITRLDGDERLAFLERYEVSLAYFYPCAVGCIQSIAEFALKDVKGGMTKWRKV